MIIFHVSSFLLLLSNSLTTNLLVKIPPSSFIILVMIHNSLLIKKHLLILLIHHINCSFIKLGIIYWILLSWKPFLINFRQVFRLIVHNLLLFKELSFSWSISVTWQTWFLRRRWWISLKTLKCGFLQISMIFWRITLLLILFPLVYIWSSFYWIWGAVYIR